MTADTIILGRFGAPHGVGGDIRVNSFTHPESNILDYQPWLVEIQGKVEEVSLTHSRPHNDQFIVHIKGFDDREKVKQLTQAYIQMPRDNLPELQDEYYWHDLVGLRVINQSGFEFGTVDHLFATGSNDIIVVSQEKKQHFIPYTEDVIVSIDLKQKLITVNWEPLD